MSNRRKTAPGNRYRDDFLRSRAWFARRDRWFRAQRRSGRPLLCALCLEQAAPRELQLHHLDYAGVAFSDGIWRAGERDEDLIAMHADCHELLHRLIERDAVLSFHRTRRGATEIALAHLRSTLQRGAGDAGART